LLCSRSVQNGMGEETSATKLQKTWLVDEAF